jgi:replicative DNA helicase
VIQAITDLYDEKIVNYRNTGMEANVLGALCHMSDPDNQGLMDAIDRLHIDCFTGFDRQQIFAIMSAQHVMGLPISNDDLMTHLALVDPKLIYLLGECLSNNANIKTVLHWVGELNKLRMDRAQFKLWCDIGSQFLSSTDWADRKEIMNIHADAIQDLDSVDAIVDRNVKSSQEAVAEFRRLNEEGNPRISSGIEDLDRVLLRGYKPGQLIAIGAPSSTGKTHLGLKLMWELHKQMEGAEGVVFSMEGTNSDVVERLITHEAGRQYSHLSASDRLRYESICSDSNISMCDKSPVSVDYIRSYCKRAAKRNPLSVIMVDYLDRVQKPKGTMRTDEKLAYICERLADLAKDFNCFVILTTQLSKEAIRRPNRRPEMSDSKNSNGTAEAPAYWFGIKRINQWDNGAVYPDSDLVELIVDKNRYGDQGIVYFRSYANAYHEINQEQARQLVKESDEQRKKNKSGKPDDEYGVLF